MQLVVHAGTGKRYAMKRLRVHNVSRYAAASVANEVRVLASHRSPFLIPLHAAFLDADALCLVMEHASRGDLARIIRHQRDVAAAPFPEARIWGYFVQLCVGVGHLHAMRVIHRDVKPENLLVDARDVLKLCDFGVSKRVASWALAAHTHVGTPLYMGPEVMRRERYDGKVDVWAAGCVLASSSRCSRRSAGSA